MDTADTRLDVGDICGYSCSAKLLSGILDYHTTSSLRLARSVKLLGIYTCAVHRQAAR